MRAGNNTEAELEFKQVALQFPQLAAPYVNLGILYRKAGQLDQSEEALKTAVQRNDGSAVAWTELGATQRLRGKFPDAAASYEKAIAADSNFAPAYRNLGVVSDLYLGDPERALTALERYKELTGEEKPVSGWIAELRARTGKPPLKRPSAAPAAAPSTPQAVRLMADLTRYRVRRVLQRRQVRRRPPLNRNPRSNRPALRLRRRETDMHNLTRHNSVMSLSADRASRRVAGFVAAALFGLLVVARRSGRSRVPPGHLPAHRPVRPRARRPRAGVSTPLPRPRRTSAGRASSSTGSSSSAGPCGQLAQLQLASRLEQVSRLLRRNRRHSPLHPSPANRVAGTGRQKGIQLRGEGQRRKDHLQLDTTQITGNQELPKVLYIVPWKRADLGDLLGKPANSLLDEVLQPIDRDVFKRENRYYDALKPDASGGADKAVPGSRGSRFW